MSAFAAHRYSKTAPRLGNQSVQMQLTKNNQGIIWQLDNVMVGNITFYHLLFSLLRNSLHAYWLNCKKNLY